MKFLGPIAKKSIVLKTMLTMGTRMSLVILLLSGIGYLHVANRFERQAIETLQKYVGERGQRERQLFTLAEVNHKIFKEDFFRRIKASGEKDLSRKFNLLVEKNKDGAYRNRTPFDGTKDVGIFIGRGTEITEEFQRRIVVIEEMVRQYGPAWHNSFQDTYVTTPENAIVVYWPESPKWAQDAMANLDMTKEEYVWVADKEHNPERTSKWTGLFYDVVGKIWMTSCETPMDSVSGKPLATVGHDVMVDELIRRALDDHLPGAQNIIFRADGRLIAHRELLPQIMAKEGNLAIGATGDAELLKIYEVTRDNSIASRVIDDESLKDYAGVFYIPETQWRFVTLYPKKIVNQAASDIGKNILLLGGLSLILELLIVGWILRTQIANPLGALLKAARELGQGQREIALDTSREDEFGILSKEFSEMANQVSLQKDQLKLQNSELENLVDQRTQELEKERAISLHASKMASLGEMAGGIAHEINNPLAVIRMSTEMLADIIKDEQEDKNSYLEKALKVFEKVQKNVDRIYAIIGALQTFSRSGGKDSFSIFSVQKLLQGTLLTWQALTTQHEIKIVLDIPPQDIYINGKVSQLSQVVVSLLNNSLDAIKDQGERWIKIEVKQVQQKVQIKVTDSGLSMTNEIADKVFNPFFTTKGVGKGAGIGLSVSHGIMLQHGGTLVLNRDSKNTQFILELPLV